MGQWSGCAVCTIAITQVHLCLIPDSSTFSPFPGNAQRAQLLLNWAIRIFEFFLRAKLRSAIIELAQGIY